MGVGFIPGGAHWSYGGFHRFRQALAAAAGYSLEAAFERPKRDIAYSWEDDGERFERSNFVDADPTDPLFLLLNHSDCDGIIPTADCEAVSRRLAHILNTCQLHFDGYDVQHGRLLVAGLFEAAERGIDLRFR